VWNLAVVNFCVGYSDSILVWQQDTHCTYARNVEARSHSHCCRGRAISIHILCLSVSSVSVLLSLCLSVSFCLTVCLCLSVCLYSQNSRCSSRTRHLLSTRLKRQLACSHFLVQIWNNIRIDCYMFTFCHFNTAVKPRGVFKWCWKIMLCYRSVVMGKNWRRLKAQCVQEARAVFILQLAIRPSAVRTLYFWKSKYSELVLWSSDRYQF
jgi:hypothetical protein